jgi:hypothetical protein
MHTLVCKYTHVGHPKLWEALVYAHAHVDRFWSRRLQADPKKTACGRHIDGKYNNQKMQMLCISSKWLLLLIKGIATSVVLLDVDGTDKAHHAFGGKILCVNLISAIDYRVIIFCCFNHRGLVSWKFGTRLRLSHGLSTHFLHHKLLIGLLFLVTASMEGGDVSNNLHPIGHVKSHLEIGWQNFSSSVLELKGQCHEIF